MERTELLDKVLDRYSTWYDVSRCEEDELPLAATAAYHEHTSGFAVSKKVEMWSADRHEYAWFFSLSKLTAENYETCYMQALAAGEKLVDPKPGHMSTNIVIVFLCDSVDDDARQKLEACRLRKNFQFSFRGWMEVQTCAVDLEETVVYANKAGLGTQQFLDKFLHPQAKKRKRNLIQRLLNRE